MIYDLIENIGHYKGLDPYFDKAIASIQSADYLHQDIGGYQVDGDRVFYMVQENKLVEPVNRFEYHRRYADLHFLVSGEEVISYAYDTNAELEPFSITSDIGFLAASKQLDLVINNRFFAFFFPGEAHLPNQVSGLGRQVRKCVYKIWIED
ncbi:DUF386 family protein [Streptococcus suis]|uniref:DUF386 family protein n=1 Tax=Streptococcus suis TaxID=1307 RepID=A0A6L8MVE1_STRSU|nr:DUF386 family protein [Streptococcus suis]NQK94328.1 DUF386 family protein [Streptococcus suis]